jgi:hypothetical protein
MAILLTPVIYLVEHRMEKYLGRETAQRMKRVAMGEEEDIVTAVPVAG